MLIRGFVFFWAAAFFVGSLMCLALGTGPQTPARWVVYPVTMLISGFVLFLVFRPHAATGTGDHTPRLCSACGNTGTRYGAGGYAIGPCPHCSGR